MRQRSERTVFVVVASERCVGEASIAYAIEGGLGGVVGLTLPMARADRGSRPVYYLPCSDLGQVVNLSLSVA